MPLHRRHSEDNSELVPFVVCTRRVGERPISNIKGRGDEMSAFKFSTADKAWPKKREKQVTEDGSTAKKRKGNILSRPVRSPTYRVRTIGGKQKKNCSN